MYIRIPLERTFNTRDLGGYPSTKGKSTKWRKFLRSDDVAFLSENDVAFLENYNVGCAIDLRGLDERQKAGYPLLSSSKVRCYHLPLIPLVEGDATKVTNEVSHKGMQHFYIFCLEKAQQEIYEVLALIAEQSDSGKGILFHCAAGKDRTGLISMFLLKIAGVSDADILANYEVTYTYIRENEKFTQTLHEYAPELLYSDRRFLEATIDYLYEHYGNFDHYFKAIGLTPEQQNKIAAFMLNE